jgi:hypothetical protein
MSFVKSATATASASWLNDQRSMRSHLSSSPYRQASAGVIRAESAHRTSSSGVGPTLAAFAVGRVNRGSFEWVAKDRFEVGLSGSPSRLQHTGDRLFKGYIYTSSTGIPPKFFPRNRVGTGPGNFRITSSAALASGSSVPISRTWKGSM